MPSCGRSFALLYGIRATTRALDALDDEQQQGALKLFEPAQELTCASEHAVK
jgi:hypothetical protein